MKSKEIFSAILLGSYVSGNPNPMPFDKTKFAYLGVKGGQEKTSAIPYSIDVEDNIDEDYEYYETSASASASAIDPSSSASPSASKNHTKVLCNKHAEVGQTTHDGRLVVNRQMIRDFLLENENETDVIEQFLENLCTIRLNDFESLFERPIEEGSRRKRSEENFIPIGDPSFENFDLNENVTSLARFLAFQKEAQGRGMGNWNTGNVQNFNGLFEGATAFNEPIGQWVTSNAVSMNNMFRGATNFNQNIDEWDVSNVEEAEGMFEGCEKFNQDLGQWNLASAEDLDNMFKDATSFVGLGLSNWDLPNIREATDLVDGTAVTQKFWFTATDPNCFNEDADEATPGEFQGDYYVVYSNDQLRNKLIELFNDANGLNITGLSYICVDNIRDFSYVFSDLDLTGMEDSNIVFWDVSRGTTFEGMFEGAGHQELLELNLDSWDMRSAANIRSMFSSVENINPSISEWVTSEVTDMSSLFYDSQSITADISRWNTESATNTSYMFYNAYRFDTDLSSWSMGNVEYMQGMFLNGFLGNPDVSNWDTGNVLRMDFMFSNSSINRNLSQWATNNCINTSFMFKDAEDFNGDISNWITSKVEDMTSMFENAVSFQEDINDWDTGSVTTMSRMFYNAMIFNSDLSNWDVENVVDFSFMFASTNNFNQNLNDWELTSALNISSMFNGAVAFNGPVDNWDTSGITNMNSVFFGASSFSSTTCPWNMASVTNVVDMFVGASSYLVDMSGIDCWQGADFTSSAQCRPLFNPDFDTAFYPLGAPSTVCGNV